MPYVLRHHREEPSFTVIIAATIQVQIIVRRVGIVIPALLANVLTYLYRLLGPRANHWTAPDDMTLGYLYNHGLYSLRVLFCPGVDSIFGGSTKFVHRWNEQARGRQPILQSGSHHYSSRLTQAHTSCDPISRRIFIRPSCERK